MTGLIVDLLRFAKKKIRAPFAAPVDIHGSWAGNPGKHLHDPVAFQSWFDTATTLDDVLSQGATDWEVRFMPYVDRHLERRSRSFEIGFGGGRLLLQAAGTFDHAAGADIHDYFDATESFLRSQKRDNFTLYRADELDAVTDRFDLIYSFIVIQHFPSLATLENYLGFIARSLDEGGIAVLYYGKLSDQFPKKVIEVSPREFRERECSLYIRPDHMEELISGTFEILDHVRNIDLEDQNKSGESGQACIVFRLKSSDTNAPSAETTA